MPRCPQVTVNADGRGATAREAVRAAIAEGRRRAVRMCGHASDTCVAVEETPVNVKYVSSTGSGANWEVRLELVFQCRRPIGCLMPVGGALVTDNPAVSDEELLRSAKGG